MTTEIKPETRGYVNAHGVPFALRLANVAHSPLTEAFAAPEAHEEFSVGYLEMDSEFWTIRDGDSVTRQAYRSVDGSDWGALMAYADSWTPGALSAWYAEPVAPRCYSCGLSRNLTTDMFGSICRGCAQ